MTKSDKNSKLVCIVVVEKNQEGDVFTSTVYQEIVPFEIVNIYISGFTKALKVYWDEEKIWVVGDYLMRNYEISDIKRMGKQIFPAPGNDDDVDGWVACYSNDQTTLSLWASNRELRFREQQNDQTA
ncbi:MAG: hypothetical protein P1P90_04655 [Patescibacteria group bacterium]|nr:hypothetical protein [Patescibacteria group bacterium]